MEDFQFDNGKGSFSVSYRKALSHNMPVNHFHSTYEIFYLMSGKRTFFIKDRTMIIEEGDVVIISPNILHRTTNTEMPKHERLIVNIHESQMASVNDAYRDIFQPLFEHAYLIIKCPLQDKLAIESVAQSIMQEMQEKKPGFEMFAQTLVLQLLIICCRHVKQNAIEPLDTPSPMYERILEVVRYMNTHYMQDLPLHLLAEKFYVSPYYLSRFFKEATGFTFVEYLNSVRIKEAKKLLEQTSLKVSLIARKVGFGSVTHFGRVFKLVTGHAPLYYRKDK
ncbi:HTH-type transcriptional activator RhaR [Paenibacillus allorhizoplanae]|uniref:HTH-type transcriptional activator RhaR n=1 Tax=Paenibacillus allorhizoplanae TaxID=2905648 RepID=A0ABN8H0L9_9BACL|nr:AraC family transcriptional regulator [Paenibacillus allorhizoplanae]CAH1222989.1 HTH-type transcriptional activator RhaR [Paenibacillus allorhizoplanae]